MIKGSKGVILVVDDDPYVLKATSLLLNNKGYSSIAGQNPRDAMKKIKDSNIDLVLADIKMTLQTGF